MTPEVIAAKNAIEWRDKRIAELEADNGKLRSLLETWLNHPYNIPLRTRTKAALNKDPDNAKE